MKRNIIDYLKSLLIRNEIRDIKADEAYSLTTYTKFYSPEELKEKLITELNRRIKNDFKFRDYIEIATYRGYREKLVLPEIAEHFRNLGYTVDLLNGEKYKEINVLIINWQSKETFGKKED